MAQLYMKLIACGYNGCVYANKDTIIKKANGKLSMAKNEIEFGKWFSSLAPGTKAKLNLVELLDYRNAEGVVDIPTPPGFKKWKEVNQKAWIQINKKSLYHHELVYPRLQYTFNDKYWSVTKIDRYKMAIDFLYTLKVMARNKFYNADIHSKNIMFGLHDKWFMIDYGAVSHKPMHLSWSLINLFNNLGCVFDFMIYPNDHKPVYDNFKDILSRVTQTDIYKKYIRQLIPKNITSALKGDLIIEFLWFIDFDLASELTGYTKWLKKQPEHIIKKFGKPHRKGISNYDVVWSLAHINDIDAIIKHLKKSLRLLENN